MDPIAVRDVVAADLVVVLGGPIGAKEVDRHPFLADELDALRALLKCRKRRSATTQRRVPLRASTQEICVVKPPNQAASPAGLTAVTSL